MRLILVRHPRPQFAEGICYGRSDLPALPELQAKVLTELLATLPDAPIITSPLRRCADLAAQLAAQRGIHATTDHRLAEMNFGQWEMQAWQDIPRTEIDAWAADMVHYHPGGGENVLEVAARICDFRADAQRQQRDLIVICHAGTIRLLSACEPGMQLHDIALHAAQVPRHIPYGSTQIVHI